MKNIIFLLFFLLSPFTNANDNSEIVISEPGSVKVPFTANILEEDIKKLLIKMLGPAASIDENLLEDAAGKAIRLKIEEIRKNPPDLWGIDEDEILLAIQNAFDAALAQVKEGIKKYNEAVNSGCSKIAKSVKETIDGMSPKITLSSNYTYVEKKKDPGDPGWSNPPDILGSPEGILASGEISLKISVSLDPEIVGNKIGGVSFDIEGKTELNVNLEATGINSNISPITASTATASVIPQIKYSISGKSGGGAVLTIHVGAGVTDRWSFSRISDKIIAGQDR